MTKEWKEGKAFKWWKFLPSSPEKARTLADKSKTIAEKPLVDLPINEKTSRKLGPFFNRTLRSKHP